MKDTKSPKKRTRIVRSYPASSFEDALPLATAIQKYGAGQKVRRLTLFENLNKSPDSGLSRKMITDSGKYGLSSGSYAAEFLELTEEGKKVTDPDSTTRIKKETEFELAIKQVEPFKKLYDQNRSNRLPSESVMKDFLIEQGLSADEVDECVNTFIVNARYIGLLRVVGGAERILPIEQVLEEIPADPAPHGQVTVITESSSPANESLSSNTIKVKEDLSNVCFYITPIGEDDSPERKHSDLFLGSIVEPAVEKLGLKVIRADQIGKAGMITAHIIDYIVRSRLVVADLSFHNPNVFYELSLRHTCRLPTVHIVRQKDRIPFDLNQFRTIRIDDTDIYSLIPRIEVYKAEITSQAKKALEDPESVENPISTFFPNLRVTQK